MKRFIWERITLQGKANEKTGKQDNYVNQQLNRIGAELGPEARQRAEGIVKSIP